VAVLIAAVLGFVGYAFALFLRDGLGYEHVEPRDIAQETTLTVGALAIIGVFILLAVQA
jgi:hypothetical protein